MESIPSNPMKLAKTDTFKHKKANVERPFIVREQLVS